MNNKVVGNNCRQTEACGELRGPLEKVLSYSLVVKVYPQLIPSVVVQEYEAGGLILRFVRVVQ